MRVPPDFIRVATMRSMDMITAAIGSARIGRANGRRIRQSGAWGVRFPPVAALGFHVLLSGEGWLITAAQEPARVRAGDIVFTAAGTDHGLAHAPCRLGDLLPIELGEFPPADGPCDCEFLCAAYAMDPGRAPAQLRHLPGVTALTPDGDPGLRAVVEMLRADLTSPGPGTEAGRSALLDLMIVHILRQLRADWPLSAAARRVGYATEFAFAAAFRRRHGVPPGRFRSSAA